MIGSASASRATGTWRRTADESKPLVVRERRAEVVDGVGDLERRRGARALVEHRRGQARDAELARRVGARRPLTTRFTWTTGTSCSSTIQTGRPFESARFWIGGQPQRRRRARAAAACERSGGCARQRRRAAGRASRHGAIASSDVSSSRASRRPTLLLASGTTVSSTRRSRGRNCRGRGLDVGRRQRAIARQVLVEVVGVAGLRCSSAFSWSALPPKPPTRSIRA